MPSDHMQPREAPPAGLVRLRARPVGGRAAECAEHVSQVTRTAQGHPACSLANGRPGSFLYRSFVFESMDRESSAPIADPRNDLAGGDQTDRRCIITSMKCGLRRGVSVRVFVPRSSSPAPGERAPRAAAAPNGARSRAIPAAVQPRQPITVWSIRRRAVLRGLSFPSRMRGAADHWD